MTAISRVEFPNGDVDELDGRVAAFVGVSAIGDVIHGIPVLCALREKYPQVRTHIRTVRGTAASILVEQLGVAAHRFDAALPGGAAVGKDAEEVDEPLAVGDLPLDGLARRQHLLDYAALLFSGAM